MRSGALLLLACCVTSGPSQLTLRVGPWRAVYRDWSSADLCQTEPSWLRDELEGVDELLGHFLESAASRGGTWSDDELPVLEQAVERLPALLAVHDRNLAALRRCPGLFPGLAAKGAELLAATRAELKGAPQMIQFIRRRQALERWRTELDAKQAAALATCGPDAGFEPAVYFAVDDELKGTTWWFCDGAVVNAPHTGGLELVRSPETWPAARLSQLKAKCFESARNFPTGQVQHVP